MVSAREYARGQLTRNASRASAAAAVLPFDSKEHADQAVHVGAIEHGRTQTCEVDQAVSFKLSSGPAGDRKGCEIVKRLS
jgi:cold shock CspA family protein